MVNSFTNCPPKEDRKIITNGYIVFNCYDSVHLLGSICLKLFQLPRFERNMEEVKTRAGPEHGKVYFDLRRRKKKESGRNSRQRGFR